jgi:uncharacterized membrane protein YgcG
MISDFIIAALIVIAPLSIVFWKFKRDKGHAAYLRQKQDMEAFRLLLERHQSATTARIQMDAQPQTNNFFDRQLRVDDRIREKVRNQAKPVEFSKPARPVAKPVIDNRRRISSSDCSSSRVSDDPISSWVDSTPSTPSFSDPYSGGGGEFSGAGASGGWDSGSSSSDSSSSSSSDSSSSSSCDSSSSSGSGD